MTAQTTTGPTRGYWIVSVLALIWNLLGILTFVMTATMSETALAAMTAAERSLYESVPAWSTAAYAIAVLAGTAGSAGLLLRKAWAVPAFVVSLLAIIVQMGHALFMSPMLEVQGPAGAIMPILLIVIAAALAGFSRSASRQGWLG